jgi:DNA polymerase-3 subunit gamma/tau
VTTEPTLQAPSSGRSENFYRKWRPRSFAELAGQEHVARTLTNALAGNRVAHAYLFCGPRGTGKTSTGRLFAKALNCTNRQSGEPCNECESCRSFLAGRAMDLIELDAASNRGIDEIRSLRDKVGFAPGAGEYKIYLIDEVHMLTDAAFNALLKTLEEPPPHAIFILATTDAQKVPATIISRCQRFDFRRAPLASMVWNLERICAGEDISCEPEALELISRSATGSHRDAVNLLDQLATSYGGVVTVENVRAGLGLIGDERAATLARLVLQGDLGGGLSLIGAIRDDGLDLRQFQKELVSELRTLLMAKSGLPPEDGATEERRRELQTTVATVPTSRLLTALRAFGEADLKPDPNSTLPLDIALAECLLGAETAAPSQQSASQAAEQGAPVARSAPAPAAAPQRMPPPPTPAPVNGAASALAAAGLPPSLPAEPYEEVEREEEASKPAARVAEPAPAPQPPAPPPMARPDPEAPRPVVAAVPGAPVAPNVAAARGQMRRLYDEVRAASPQLGGLLNSVCDIIAADEDELVIGFKFPVHAERAAAKTNLAVLSEVASRIFGRTVSVRCVQDEAVETWRQRDSASRSALVRAAQEMGAQVISSTEPETGPEV